jgi:hypothetical protein
LHHCILPRSDSKNTSLLFPSTEFVASGTEVAFWSDPDLVGKLPPAQKPLVTALRRVRSNSTPTMKEEDHDDEQTHSVGDARGSGAPACCLYSPARNRGRMKMEHGLHLSGGSKSAR